MSIIFRSSKKRFCKFYYRIDDKAATKAQELAVAISTQLQAYQASEDTIMIDEEDTLNPLFYLTQFKIHPPLATSLERLQSYSLVHPNSYKYTHNQAIHH
jgi:hypothetical protein